jgi:hypothetical protein
MPIPLEGVLLKEFCGQWKLGNTGWPWLAIGGPESHINAIVKGRRSIHTDTDLRLCLLLGADGGTGGDLAG